MPELKQLGEAGVSAGWRKKLADRVAPPVASRTRLSPDQVRAALGLIFVGLSLSYVARTVLGFARRSSS